MQPSTKGAILDLAATNEGRCVGKSSCSDALRIALPELTRASMRRDASVRGIFSENSSSASMSVGSSVSLRMMCTCRVKLR